MVGDATRGTAVSTSTMKLGPYLDDWFATAKQSLRPTTAHGYLQAIGRSSNTSARTGCRR